MAPKAADKAPAKAPAKKTTDSKKKKKVSKAETYKIYIYKVLKQVHPDTGECTGEGGTQLRLTVSSRRI
jgi:histone H2B